LWVGVVAQIAMLAPRSHAADRPPNLEPALVQASLVADVASVAPGATFRLAVRLVMENGWHVNWLNPGDAGLAPSVAWRLPEGFRPGLLEWPHPERFVTGPLVIFGYAAEVLLVTEVRAPAAMEAGSEVELLADVSWLACAEACIPGSATVSLRLPVEAASRPDADGVRRIEGARRRRPALSGAWHVEARTEDTSRLVLEVQTAAESTPLLDGLFFFPYEPGVIENAAAQVASVSPGPGGRIAYQLRVELSRVAPHPPSRLTGVLVCASGWTAGGGPGAIEVDVPVFR
jgi:thiol:disulfide interchange protein DsbD